MTRSYEELRAAVVDSVPRQRVDVQMLVSQGVWAWIECFGSGALPLWDRSQGSEPLTASTRVVRPSAWRAPLVSVWAGLLMGRLAAQEMT